MAQPLYPGTAQRLLDEVLEAYQSSDFQERLHALFPLSREERILGTRELCEKFQSPILIKYGIYGAQEGQLAAACSRIRDAQTSAKWDMLRWLSDLDLQAQTPSTTADVARKELRVRYHKDGFVFPLHALTPHHVQEALAGFSRFREEHVARLEACGGYSMNHAWLPWVRSMARHPSITSAVADAFSGASDVYLWDSELVSRTPGMSELTESGRGWHRDQKYLRRLWPMDRNHFVTVYVALTACDRSRGCLLVRRGKSRKVATGDEIPMELLPGQFALFAPGTPRVGGTNEASAPTYGVLLRYVRASVIDLSASSEARTLAMLVSGVDTRGFFEQMPEPHGEATEEGLGLRQYMLSQRQGKKVGAAN